jgi:hypothetical protein
MQFAVSNTTAGTLKHKHSNFYLAAGLGLVMAALTATAAWRLNLAGTGSTTPAARTSVTYVAPPATERGMTFYLVGSEAQAALVLQGEEDAGRVRAADLDGSLADTVDVIVVNDDQSLRNATTAINDSNAVRAQSGLSDPKVFDLRALTP